MPWMIYLLYLIYLLVHKSYYRMAEELAQRLEDIRRREQEVERREEELQRRERAVSPLNDRERRRELFASK